MKQNRPSVLLIYTGGTIGMKEDPEKETLRPYKFDELLSEVPELGKLGCEIDSVSFDPLIDSSDVSPKTWETLLSVIESNYEKYDGFVVLHGTDTMAYSASVLSFMISDLDKPVIFTGSQLPIGRPRTDGRENLISAVEIASSKDSDGKATVPEVAIFFGLKLFRGNRAVKFDASGFDAFKSPGYPPLATAGIDIKYNNSIIRKAAGDGVPTFNYKLDTRVSVLKVHPGITEPVVRDILCGEGSRAVILETYGVGNVPGSEWLLDCVREAGAMGKIVLNVSQCAKGAVNMNLYANGKSLGECGVIGGQDISVEAALGKLFHLLGNHSSNGDVKRLLPENLRGEISD